MEAVNEAPESKPPEDKSKAIAINDFSTDVIAFANQYKQANYQKHQLVFVLNRPTAAVVNLDVHELVYAFMMNGGIVAILILFLLYVVIMVISTVVFLHHVR